VKTQVRFRSTKFPAYEGEQEQVNPGLWGKRLAEYLVLGLKRSGVETEDIIPEDWGWYIRIANANFPLGVGCGHQSGHDDEFLCFTDPPRTTIKRWFKKIDATPQLEKVVSALQAILASDPSIKDIAWTEPE
jgi:hypothetical protein